MVVGLTERSENLAPTSVCFYRPPDTEDLREVTIQELQMVIIGRQHQPQTPMLGIWNLEALGPISPDQAGPMAAMSAA